MVKYRVHWLGFPSDDDTWELEEHLEGCQELLQEFKRKVIVAFIHHGRQFVLSSRFLKSSG